MKQEIIRDRIAWNKKKTMLQQHYPVIFNCLGKQWYASQVHAHLASLNVRFSYSTVARFIASLVKVQKRLKFTAVPGWEAKVFFIPVGKFLKQGKKVQVWVFIMKLSYSKYCFCQEVTDKSFECFLQCNHKAFAFFKAVPHSIKVNRTNAFNINEPALKERYYCFLKSLGVCLFAKSKRNCFITCQAEIRFFKEQFLFHVLHQDHKRFSRELKRWYTTGVNLGIHPFTKKIIAKEFVKNELPKMLSLSAHTLKK